MDLEYYRKNAPAGYRFLPEDSDMLGYLHWKKLGHPNANILKDVPLYDYGSDELQSVFHPGKEDEWYVFFTTSKPLKGSRMGRKAGNGRWKVTIGDKEIADEARNLKGYKKTLRFSLIQDGKEKKTGWTMLEYRLAHANGKRKTMDNLFLCKIYKSRGSSKLCEASKDENLSMSSMDDNELEMSINSSDYVQCSTNVTNGIQQYLFDVNSKECVENKCQLPEYLPSMGADPITMEWIRDFLMNDQ